ncbi:MAG: acyl-ACP--UDP-N-acetylglucosamine O-acyltransferase [Maricaulaceae bacterium]
MATFIHETSIVDSGAELGVDVHIGPFTTIGQGVKLGDRTHLESHINLNGNLILGADNKLSPFVTMGHPPQDFKHKGGDVGISIGDRNNFREYVNVHPGSDAGKPMTIIGNDCYMMVGTHLAHEGHMGNHVVVSNGAQIGGSVTIGDYAILGGLCAIHQFTRIGAHAFIGGMATVTTDVIPYGSVVGNSAYLAGLNIIGLRRRGFDRHSIKELRSAYRLLFAEEGTFAERLEDVERIYSDQALVMDMINFIRAQNRRNICMPNMKG